MNKRQSRLLPLLAAAVMALTVVACNASTSHISSLTVAKDKDQSSQTNTFGPHDAVYAKGDASNLAGKVTLNWQLVAEKVDGQPPNAALPNLNKSFDLDADGTTSYDLTPPASGWPLGTYKIILTMMDNGTQRDQKTQEFTVSGT